MRVFLLGLASLVVVTPAATTASAGSARDLIVFVRQDPRTHGLNDGVDLWLVGIGGGARRLVGGKGWDESPAWSPEGKRIAFTKSLFEPAEPDVALKSADVWTVNVGGRSRRNLTREDSASSPAWSPDGRRLAFARGDGVFLVRRDGSGRVRIALADDPGDPAWSPDGRRVAFAVPGEVHVVDANGKRQRLLARGAGSGSSVAWSPDGRLIAFTGMRRGVTGAFLVNAGEVVPTCLPEAIWNRSGRRTVARSPSSGRARDARPASSSSLPAAVVRGA